MSVISSVVQIVVRHLVLYVFSVFQKNLLLPSALKMQAAAMLSYNSGQQAACDPHLARRNCLPLPTPARFFKTFALRSLRQNKGS